MSFRITLSPGFRERLWAKPSMLQGAILKCIDLLGDNPAHPGLRSKRIQGDPGMWEARVDRRNRVSWKYGDTRGEIVVVNHCTHDEVLP